MAQRNNGKITCDRCKQNFQNFKEFKKSSCRGGKCVKEAVEKKTIINTPEDKKLNLVYIKRGHTNRRSIPVTVGRYWKDVDTPIIMHIIPR